MGQGDARQKRERPPGAARRHRLRVNEKPHDRGLFPSDDPVAVRSAASGGYWLWNKVKVCGTVAPAIFVHRALRVYVSDVALPTCLPTVIK
jgi:hypothetical protein